MFSLPPAVRVCNLKLMPTILHMFVQVAKRHAGPFCSSLGYQEPNMHYVKGDIQDLQKAGIADSSVDLIISNCVINLCSDKLKVLKEAYRVLADGGELYFSDVYCDRRLPKSVLQHEVQLAQSSRKLCWRAGSMSD